MARSRRRRTTTERAAGLLALALPAPVQRVADTPIGSLLMLVGIPAMLVFGCLNIKIVDGFPTLSLNGQKAAELQRAASQHLSELEHQVANQNWGVATDLLHAAQGANSSLYPNNTPQTQPTNAAYLAQLQQYQWQQQQQQLQQRQAYQQPLYPQQIPYGQSASQQQPYSQSTYSNPAYQQPSHQQPTYQQLGYQQPAYQQPQYQQPTYQQQPYQQPSYPQQPYQQPNYQQTANQGQTAYHPTNNLSNGSYGQAPAQTTGYPVPVNQNNRLPLPSTTNSSQRFYNQPGSLLR